jgi:hypothetical protein
VKKLDFRLRQDYVLGTVLSLPRVPGPGPWLAPAQEHAVTCFEKRSEPHIHAHILANLTLLPTRPSGFHLERPPRRRTIELQPAPATGRAHHQQEGPSYAPCRWLTIRPQLPPRTPPPPQGGRGNGAAASTTTLSAMGGASFRVQARALALKSWHYQSRKRCQNCCLVLLPLLFMTLLAVLQSLINDAIEDAGLTCALQTVVNASCAGVVNCSAVSTASLAADLGLCTGSVASNEKGSGRDRRQDCVYTQQLASLVTNPSSISFSIGAALIPEGGDSTRANVMTGEKAEEQLLASGRYTSVTTQSTEDVGNSKLRQLPFCPIARPEPYPAFGA